MRVRGAWSGRELVLTTLNGVGDGGDKVRVDLMPLMTASSSHSRTCNTHGTAASASDFDISLCILEYSFVFVACSGVERRWLAMGDRAHAERLRHLEPFLAGLC